MTYLGCVSLGCVDPPMIYMLVLSMNVLSYFCFAHCIAIFRIQGI